MTKGLSIKQAAESWVFSFNAIQQQMIARLMLNDPDEWAEVTVPDVGNRVFIFNSLESGYIIDFNPDDDLYSIELDNGKIILIKRNEFEVEYDYKLPMWGTMWAFSDSADIYWLEEGNGIAVMSKCGFRIVEHQDFGFFFGIDGMGYDFYEEHWIPLYKARGLLWHDQNFTY